MCTVVVGAGAGWLQVLLALHFHMSAMFARTHPCNLGKFVRILQPSYVHFLVVTEAAWSTGEMDLKPRRGARPQQV